MHNATDEANLSMSGPAVTVEARKPIELNLLNVQPELNHNFVAKCSCPCFMLLLMLLSSHTVSGGVHAAVPVSTMKPKLETQIPD